MSDINFVLMATAWGPRHGGINAFNRDFSVGLAAALGNRGRVFCAVLDPKDSDHADAESGNVTLIPIVGKNASDQFDTAWTFEIVHWLKKNGSVTEIAWWVGHDVTSGAAALAGPEAGLGGRPALIHHMSYINYQAVKHDDGPAARAKDEEQKRLFASKDAVLFGVGPLLRDSCQRLAGDGRKPVMLVPGFPEINLSRKATSDLVAVSFGRMEMASDRIKQGQLAVAAFGAAINSAANLTPALRPSSMNSPRLYVIGLPEGEKEETKKIYALAESNAGQIVNILPLPFDENRQELFNRLAEANLAFMLSWHEGFGLTGWEAIAAEVPLIISEQSGLFKLLHETLDGAETGYVCSISVKARRGEGDTPNYTKNDLLAVGDKILETAGDLTNALRRAKHLKNLLQERLICRWDHTGHQFLTGLGIGGPSALLQPIPPGPDSPLANENGKPVDSPTSGLAEDRRSLSRDQRFDRLKRAIRKDLALSERVVQKLEKALGLVDSKPPPLGERAEKLCEKLLHVKFENAIQVLNSVRHDLEDENTLDKEAIKSIANVSGWLFPWLYIRAAEIDLDLWERKELGEVISLPTDIDNFAEIIMAGIDIRMAAFQTTRDPRGWPRPATALTFGMPEEGLNEGETKNGVVRAADEDNIRKALALSLGVHNRKKHGPVEEVDDSINQLIEFELTKNNARWYIVCDGFTDEGDRKRHMDLMREVASRYKGLAVIELGLRHSDHQRKFREIQQLLNLHGSQPL